MKSTPAGLKHNHKAPDDLLSHLRGLVEEAESALEKSPDESAGDPASTLGARFDAAQERISDLYASAKGKAVDRTRRTHHAIRANPYKSIAIATGVGLVVGLLLGRRNK